MQNDKFTELLSKRAKDFVLTPNANALDKILAQKNQQNNKRKRFIWLTVAACFIAALLVGITQYSNFTNNQIAETNNIEPNHSESKKTEKESFAAKNTEGKKPNNTPIKSESTEILNQQKGYSEHSMIAIGRRKSKAIKAIIDPKIKLTNEAENLPTNTDLNKVILLQSNPILPKENEVVSAEKKEVLVNKIDSIILEKNIKVDSIITIENLAQKHTDSIPKIVKNTAKKIGFQLALFNNYMLVNKAYNGADNETIINNFGVNYNEQANQSYSVGMMVGLTVNQFIFSTGIAYNNVQFDKIYKIQKTSLTTNIKEKFVNDAGYNINVIDQSLSFLEIPLSLGYKMGAKKISMVGEIGAAFQFLKETKTYTLHSDSSGLVAPTTNEYLSGRFEKIQLLFFASLQAQYNINKHFSFFVGPTMRVHTNPYFKKEFTERPASQYFGIVSGIKINF